MPRLQYGLSAFERARGGLPSLPVVNMFAESVPVEETGVILQSRPGLEDRDLDMGPGPVQALFQQDGIMSGQIFAVSGTRLVAGTTTIDVMDGDGPWSISGWEDRLFIAGGARLWTYDASTLSVVTFPDGQHVSKVLVADSRAVCIAADTGQIYWSDVLDTTIDSLSFATAEAQPDALVDMVFTDGMLVLGGRETIEFWPSTGDADLPFAPLKGRVFENGVKTTGCLVKFATSFVWIAKNNEICLGNPETIISTPGMEALIEASTSARLWTFWLEGAEFLALQIDGRTFVYPARSRLWHEFTSAGQSQWIPQCYANGVFGSSLGPETFAWSDGHEDLGGTMERRFRAGIPFSSAGLQVDNIVLRTNPGHTAYLSGDYADPAIEMRLSRDGGNSWGEWRSRTLGTQGQYRKKVQWTGCGMAGQPGLLAEFRVTAPIDFRVSDVRLNEPYGGI